MFSKIILRGSALVALFVAGFGLATPRAMAAPVVYLAGDSTVMSYRASYNLYPQQGWGGRISENFTTGVSFNNKAIGGRSSKSFVDEGRLTDILNQIQPGDYLFVQFGHNDGSSDPAKHTDPFTTFKTYLAMYIDGAVQKGAIPVLVTPMGRRNYGSDGKFINDFTDRCTAMKQLATAKNCKLIDLNAKSIAYYNSIGAAATTGIFLWLEAGQYPNFPNGIHDATHFQEKGAVQLARLVTQGISEANLGIKSFIKPAGPIANGTYSLRNVASGKMLDNVGSTADGAEVKQWADGTSNNQKWVVTNMGGSTYKLSCVTGGRYLDSLGHTANGSTVGQWAGGYTANQSWTITLVSGSNYRLINIANGKCLDTGGGTANGSVMQFWGSGSSSNQLWQFVAP